LIDSFVVVASTIYDGVGWAASASGYLIDCKVFQSGTPAATTGIFVDPSAGGTVVILDCFTYGCNQGADIRAGALIKGCTFWGLQYGANISAAPRLIDCEFRATGPGAITDIVLNSGAAPAMVDCSWTSIGGAGSIAYGEGDRAKSVHHTQHQSGGADAIKLDDLAAPDDNMDLNASTSSHGLLLKLSGNATDVLLGNGTWGAGGVSSDHATLTHLAYADAGHTGFQAALSLPLSAANGGTGHANGVSTVLILPNATLEFSGGGANAKLYIPNSAFELQGGGANNSLILPNASIQLAGGGPDTKLTLPNAAIELQGGGAANVLKLPNAAIELAGGGASAKLTLPNAATTITGGGTLALGGYTLTVPATGIVPLGTGIAGRMAYWNATNTLTAGTEFSWDVTNQRLGIGIDAPWEHLDVRGDTLVLGADVTGTAGKVWAEFTRDDKSATYAFFDLQTNAFNIQSGLTNGSITITPTGTGVLNVIKDIYASIDVRIGGGLYVGGVATNPATGDVVATADGRFAGGLFVGAATVDPPAGWIQTYHATDTMITMNVDNTTNGTCRIYFGDVIYKAAIMFLARNNYYRGDLCFINRVSGDATEATSADTKMKIDAFTGYVGIGMGLTDPSYLLHLNSDSAGKPGAGGLWTVVSDKRIKENISLADLNRCYEIVKTLPLKRFKFRDACFSPEQAKDRHVLGWIAQDVEPVFPKAVGRHDFTLPGSEEVIKDCLDLNSGQILAALYGAVQKLIKKVEKLETI
jgi:hypothetical protein